MLKPIDVKKVTDEIGQPPPKMRGVCMVAGI